MNCTNCNSEMVYFIDGFTCGWKCTKCNMELVTSYYDIISLDENEYAVTVNKVSIPNATQIKTAAEISKCNFILSKEKLLEGFVIKGLNAKDTRDILSKLKAVNLTFSVNPAFDYEY